jgi:hypothetical protein
VLLAASRAGVDLVAPRERSFVRVSASGFRSTAEDSAVSGRSGDSERRPESARTGSRPRRDIPAETGSLEVQSHSVSFFSRENDPPYKRKNTRQSDAKFRPEVGRKYSVVVHYTLPKSISANSGDWCFDCPLGSRISRGDSRPGAAPVLGLVHAPP